MFHSRKLNNNINELHERALRITYRDQNSSFESLLKKIHLQLSMPKILKVILTEMFKTKNYQNPDFIREVFPLRNNSYNLRYNNEFLQPKVKTVFISDGNFTCQSTTTVADTTFSYKKLHFPERLQKKIQKLESL